MVYGKRQRLKHVLNVILVVTCSACVIVAGWLLYARVVSTGTTDENIKDTSTGSVLRPVSISSRVLHTGEVFWGRYIDDAAKKSPEQKAFPFSGVSSFKRTDYDAWVGDLECPLWPEYVPSAEQDTVLQFACLPEYVSEAAKWFDVFTLANNHMNDRGESGFKFTKTTLDQNNIQYFGVFDPSRTNELCEIVSLPARYRMSDSTYKESFLPVVMCGMHHVIELPDAQALAEIKMWSEMLPVWVYGHMGTEYATEPSQIQTDTYRSFIDAGADVVIGTHPHRMQKTEVYKGRLILYSLGNFIFDQWGAAEQGGTEVQRGAVLSMLAETKIDQISLLWSRLAPECVSFQDTCLESARTQGLKRFNLNYTYDVIASDNRNSGAAQKASDEWQVFMENRLNWAATSAELEKNGSNQ
jgi:hypothetical protein